MDYTLTDAELVLLLLISEQPGINGYGIRRLVEQRGLAAWAGVASSSIYNGLKRIDERGLAVSSPDTEKQDRGPRGRAFRPTEAGEKALRGAVSEGLASTREHDPRFNIALSGVEIIGSIEAADRLAERAMLLESEHDRLTRAQAAEATTTIAADLLFGRILHTIDAERRWTVDAATKLRSVAA